MRKRKTMPAGKKAGEKALNLALLALLVLLFVQCWVYMARFIESRRTSSDIPFDMRILSASSADTKAELDPGLLCPQAIAVRTEDGVRALLHSAAILEEIYGTVNECLYTALCSEPVLAGEEDWQNAAAGGNVLVQYPSELPYQVICAFAAAGKDESLLPRRGSVYVGVRELLLCPDETGALGEVLVRGSSGIFRFVGETEYVYPDFLSYLTVYEDAFCRAEVIDSGEQMVLDVQDALTVRAIHTARGLTSLLSTNPDFLRLLNFNPDKLNFHTESGGNMVYVESHGILRSGEDELTYQAADPGGIDIALLGTEKSDIYAYLQAASSFMDRMERLNEQYTGGDASLQLERVYSDGTAITLEFAFRCDNVLLVREGEDNGLTMTFSENKLVSLQYRMCIVRRTLEERRVPLASWYRQMLGGDEDTPMRLVYDTGEEIQAAAAQWVRMESGYTAQERTRPWAGQN